VDEEEDGGTDVEGTSESPDSEDEAGSSRPRPSTSRDAQAGPSRALRSHEDGEDERAMLGQLRKKAAADVDKGKAIKRQLVGFNFPPSLHTFFRLTFENDHCSLYGIRSWKPEFTSKNL
jgi:hypothetical protein